MIFNYIVKICGKSYAWQWNATALFSSAINSFDSQPLSVSDFGKVSKMSNPIMETVYFTSLSVPLTLWLLLEAAELKMACVCGLEAALVESRNGQSHLISMTMPAASFR